MLLNYFSIYLTLLKNVGYSIVCRAKFCWKYQDWSGDEYVCWPKWKREIFPWTKRDLEGRTMVPCIRRFQCQHLILRCWHVKVGRVGLQRSTPRSRMARLRAWARSDQPVIPRHNKAHRRNGSWLRYHVTPGLPLGLLVWKILWRRNSQLGD